MIDNQVANDFIGDTINGISRLSISDTNLPSSTPNEILLNEACQVAQDNETVEAKPIELHSWKQQIVYGEIPDNVQ